MEAYFPPGIWYSLWGGASVDAGDEGVSRTLAAPLGHIPVHARGGSILPMQRPALLTQEVRNSPLRLMVHLPRQVRRSDVIWTAVDVLGVVAAAIIKISVAPCKALKVI